MRHSSLAKAEASRSNWTFSRDEFCIFAASPGAAGGAEDPVQPCMGAGQCAQAIESACAVCGRQLWVRRPGSQIAASAFRCSALAAARRRPLPTAAPPAAQRRRHPLVSCYTDLRPLAMYKVCVTITQGPSRRAACAAATAAAAAVVTNAAAWNVKQQQRRCMLHAGKVGNFRRPRSRRMPFFGGWKCVGVGARFGHGQLSSTCKRGRGGLTRPTACDGRRRRSAAAAAARELLPAACELHPQEAGAARRRPPSWLACWARC